jgi:outer membrane protein OmpA-like peptidoglycan-associated protein/tetratricopeptide (TPR) repeat protein
MKLNVKYFTAIFLLALTYVGQNLNAQNSSDKDKIEIIVGSYKYYNNAYLYKKILKKEGFKRVRVLAKRDGFHRVSVNQFITLTETNEFIDSVGIKEIDYWLLYQENYKAPSEILVTEIDSLKVKLVSIPVDEITQKLFNDSLDSSKVIVKDDENIISLNSNTNIEIKVDTKNVIDEIEKNEDNQDPIETGESFNIFQLENKIAVDLPVSNDARLSFDSSRIDSLSNKVDNKKQNSVNNIFSAKSKYEAYEFSPAIDRYLKLARSGKGNKEVFENLALAYYNNSQYDLATVWFNKLITLYPKNLDSELYFKASIAFKSIEAYDASDQFYKKYLELNKQLILHNYLEPNSNYIDTILSNSRKYNLFKTNINSQNSDFGLNFYGEDEVIFASSLDATGSQKFKWSNEPFLDLFTAQIDSLGNLSQREQLKGNVNTKYHESTATISMDGNTMYFTRNNFFKGRLKSSKDKQVKLKIYKATKNQDSWSNIKELPFNGNQYSTAHPTLSPDGKKLYFSSDMPGTFGMSDIWFVYIFENDTYSQPINLGPNVNTEFRESFPFIDTKNNLYFSSDGKLGLGGFDVFESKLNIRGFPYETSNIGKPVNSTFDDFSYVYNNKRNFGFISSNRNGLNGSSSDEVYKIIKTEKSPQSVLLKKVVSSCEGHIGGVVYDIFTKDLLQGASIELLNENNNIIKQTKTDQKGKFNFTEKFNCSKSYFIRVSNGISYTSRILKFNLDENQNIFENIDLSWLTNCLPDDLICVLGVEPIFFSLDKSTLTRSSVLSLKKVLIAMVKYPTMILQISSYADSRASKEYNRELSERRAITTKKWLTNNGIDPNRLIIKALGEENFDNICGDRSECSESEYQLNRKSTFKILFF